MKRKLQRALEKRKRRLERRLSRMNFAEAARPMMAGCKASYELSERTEATACGGLGMIHLMARKLGLIEEIDTHVSLLKAHLPYHESDHVLNIAYNILAGGERMEDIELRRRDEVLLNGLGAKRLPDPTTAGDFTRRFAPSDILDLQECVNRTRRRVWALQPAGFLDDAFIDVDGTIAGTLGECKQGIGLSYKGIWGYAPLVVSLANTKEVLYLVNRPGNHTSHQDSVEWIDRAVELVKPAAKQITLRGDTDFSHTAHLDRWDGNGVKFVLGLDAHAKVVGLAEGLPASAWARLERPAKYEVLTEPRTKPERIKEKMVRDAGYKNIVPMGEDVAEIEYQPVKCGKPYRLIVLRKNLSVQRGEAVLFEDFRYFFYLTNRQDLTQAQTVGLANQRGDQENVVEQLKNGVNAMRMPVDNLQSNWAYMVMAALAWNLKAWFALLMPARERGLELLQMEFRRFLHAVMLLPCQVVRTARRIIWRLLSYNEWSKDFFATFDRVLLLAGP